jgi:hypothetical protein
MMEGVSNKKDIPSFKKVILKDLLDKCAECSNNLKRVKKWDCSSIG